MYPSIFPLFSAATQEEAATAYDMAAIEYRGLNAVTNFDLSRYIKWLRPSQNNSTPDVDPSQLENPNHEIGLSFLHHQQISAAAGEEAAVPQPRPGGGATASSALGLLLQSSKFKEMLERTSAADFPATHPKSELPRCSFPDDIQTYFECQDSGSFADGDDIIFGELNSFASPIFQCELDA